MKRILLVLALLGGLLLAVILPATANAGTRVGGKATVGIVQLDGTRVGVSLDGTRVGAHTDGTRVGLRANNSAMLSCTLGICGKIQNSAKSPISILVADCWPATATCAHWQNVAPGKWSTFKDTDAFNVPKGYWGAFTPWPPPKNVGHFKAGWYKITDIIQMPLTVFKCSASQISSGWC